MEGLKPGAYIAKHTCKTEAAAKKAAKKHEGAQVLFSPGRGPNARWYVLVPARVAQ